MRDPQRIPDVLHRLLKVWAEHPDYRLGQLIQNVFPDSMFHMEDELFITAIEKFYASNPVYRNFSKAEKEKWGMK